MLIWLLTACGPEPTATLFADITDQEGLSIANPTIDVYNDVGELLNTVNGDDRGNFVTDLPVESGFYLVIAAENYETHSFTGFSGVGEVSAESGALWLRTRDAADAIRAEFSDCSSTSGSFVDGQARVYLEGQDLPATITTATLKVIGPDAMEYPACYKPTVDPETGEETPSDVTGENGEFGIFGLQPGVQQISLTAKINQVENTHLYNIFVPENGSVPKYPLLVPITAE